MVGCPTPKGRSRERVKECLGGRQETQSARPRSQSQVRAESSRDPRRALHLPPSLTIGSPEGGSGQMWGMLVLPVHRVFSLVLALASTPPPPFIKKASKLLSVLSCLPPFKGPCDFVRPRGGGAVSRLASSSPDPEQQLSVLSLA